MQTDETAADLPRVRRCALGQISDLYLSRARTGPERLKRVRALNMFGSRHAFGVAISDLAAAWGIDQTTARADVAWAIDQLRACAVELGFAWDDLFPRVVSEEED